jgi:hypothetical protein
LTQATADAKKNQGVTDVSSLKPETRDILKKYEQS